jgi:hypothetical protein
VGRSACHRGASPREARLLFARWTGSESSRDRRLSALERGSGEVVDDWASPPHADGLCGPAARAAMWASAARGVIESMNGARFVHDRLEEHGWDVLIADGTKVKGLAPWACDRQGTPASSARRARPHRASCHSGNPQPSPGRSCVHRRARCQAPTGPRDPWDETVVDAVHRVR